MRTDDSGRSGSRPADLLGAVGDAEVIDRDTDFFEVGGNSVLTARLVASLRGTLDVPVSMREVFVARTPAEIATRVLRKGGA